MTDNASSTAAGDIPSIDVSNDTDLHTWATKLDVSPQQLRDAVAAVGPRATDVELHLKGTRSTTQAEQVHDALKRPD